MPAAAPFISVIVVCRNPGLPRLRLALDSVWLQIAAAGELIVVDGASTDGTREWLETQRPRLGALITEPDRGVYDAMNKGVAAARGDWLLFLGADDRLEPDAFARLAPVLAQTTGGVVAGEAVYSDGRVYRPGAWPVAVRRNFLQHQACFYHRSVFVAGGFDAALRYQADYDLNLRIGRAGMPIVPAAGRVAVCGAGGLSDAGHWANYREEIAVRHRHFPAWRCWPWDLVSLIRFLRKKILRTFSAHG